MERPAARTLKRAAFSSPSSIGVKSSSSAWAEQRRREGGILLPAAGLGSPHLMPGLGISAADRECQLLVELAPGGGGGVAGTTSTPGSSSMAREPAARRRSTTRDRAEHTKISLTRLLQDYVIPGVVLAGDDDTIEVVVGQHTSGTESSSSSSLQLQQGATNEDQVNITVPDPAIPAGMPPLHLTRSLGTTSGLTVTFVLNTALFQPAVGVLFGPNKACYYATLGAIFASGVAEGITAVWLSRSCDANRRRFTIGRVVLCGSVVPLVAILGIGGSRFIKG